MSEVRVAIAAGYLAMEKRIEELEDKLQKATDNYDSACRQISFMAKRMERFETLQAEQAELAALRKRVDELVGICCTYDVPEEALLQEKGE